ncbi:MAG: hypothetical protein A3K03_08795, partial [Bdellovibrionales bacterium RIFOXYD1_FULL_44_7]
PSTSTSELLLEVTDLNLVLNTDVYRPLNWRDLFTALAKDPFGTLFHEADRLHIARNISFSVKRGDRIGIIGVNGSGKTTLCRCIAGMYVPTSGTIVRKGKMRAVFDTAIGIQPELTGRENATLLAEFMYADQKNKLKIINDALQFSELGSFIDVPFRLYSKGMQARLCLSLVSARPCDLLILDEVFDGADVFFSEKISARVLDVIHRSGAVLFVSHSFDQIKKVCNRVLVLSGGQIIFDGEVEKGIAVYKKSGSQSAN